MSTLQPADIGHLIGGDLQLGPTGDLAAVMGLTRSQQRVLRRLLTPLGNYIWNLNYGGSLPQLVGQPVSVPTIEAIVRQQMRLEASVVQSPPPTIAVQAGTNGAVFVAISYVEADTGQSQVLNVPLG